MKKNGAPKAGRRKAAPPKKTALRKAAAKPRAPADNAGQTIEMVGDGVRAKTFLKALGELGKRIHPLMTESELLHRFRTAIQSLFPKAAWVLRLRDRDGKFVLRFAERTAALPKVIAGGESAGALALREGRVVHLQGHTLSEVVRSGPSSVFPLQVALTALGYWEIALDPGDTEGLQVAEMLAGQLAVSLRTLQSTDEAQNLKSYLSSVVDNANCILILVDPDGRIKFFNRVAESASGYAREEVLGRNLLRVFRFHTGDRDELRRIFAQALGGLPIVNFESRYRTKDGAVRFALFNSAPILDVSGAMTDVIITGIDQTEAKHLERQVMQAEKLSSLGEMAAGIAHELNNPLTAIYANADLELSLARRAGRGEAETRRMTAILEGAERIRTLLRDIMGYVRPASEERTQVDLNKVIEKSLTFCNYEFTRAGVTLRRDLESPLALISGSPHLLQQVLVNLFTNACHSMDGKRGVLTVRTLLSAGTVVVEVEDTGAGIEAEHLGQIFLPFFSTKREGEGTGLGLSIVMRILENHGARVKVESSPGAGARFRLAFPYQPQLL